MTEKAKKAVQSRRTFSAMEKAQAVLSVWSERRNPAEVCREYGVKWANLNHWQTKALEGMLKGLEPRNAKKEHQRPAIGGRLKKLLEKQIAQHEKSQSRLQQRLTQIQEKKELTSPQKV